MIKLRGKGEVSDPSNKIIFEPRGGFSRGRAAAPTLEFPLIYGHRCPYCGNVIQALFKAPREFSLWPYEETILLSQGEKNSGEIRKTFPDDKTQYGKTCYRMNFSPAEGGSIKLTLKNHVMRHASLSLREVNGEGLWEPGEKPCTKAAIFSLREDLLVKDFLLFSLMVDYEVSKYNIPKAKDLIPENDTNFRVETAVGQAPPVILVDRTSFVYGFHYQTRRLMTNYRKQGQ
jgi:hypothetical protein